MRNRQNRSRDRVSPGQLSPGSPVARQLLIKTSPLNSWCCHTILPLSMSIAMTESVPSVAGSLTPLPVPT